MIQGVGNAKGSWQQWHFPLIIDFLMYFGFFLQYCAQWYFYRVIRLDGSQQGDDWQENLKVDSFLFSLSPRGSSAESVIKDHGVLRGKWDSHQH